MKKISISHLKNRDYSTGFTAVELVITLFIAAAFLTTGYQLFSLITRDSGESSGKSIVSNVAYDYLQDYKSYTTNPCTASTPIENAPITINGVSNATVSVTISCPYANSTSLSKISVTISYNDPLQTLGISTYHIFTPSLNPDDWITIGTQSWSKTNINVGTMIINSVNQTDNGIIEKYCYNNIETNCTDGGGLYQWDEAMQYTNIAGARGICPVGSHLPTIDEWNTLINYLGSSTAGTQLKIGGSSGLDIPLPGYRNNMGGFVSIGSYGNLWSSTESIPDAHYIFLYITNQPVGQATVTKAYGLSLRCVAD